MEEELTLEQYMNFIEDWIQSTERTLRLWSDGELQRRAFMDMGLFPFPFDRDAIIEDWIATLRKSSLAQLRTWRPSLFDESPDVPLPQDQ